MGNSSSIFHMPGFDPRHHWGLSYLDCMTQSPLDNFSIHPMESTMEYTMESMQYNSHLAAGARPWHFIWLKPGSREGRVRNGLADLPSKILSWGQKLHMALTSDRCQSNGSDHLSNNQHNFKGLGWKSTYHMTTIKLDSMTLTPFENGSRAPG